MAEEGIFLPPSQFEGMFLSTAHTEEHIAKTVEAFHTVYLLKFVAIISTKLFQMTNRSSLFVFQ